MAITDSSTLTLERYRSAVAVLSDLPADIAVYRSMSESVLLELNQLHATVQRIVGSNGALLAGEIAYRSAPSLGSRGLAQRAGHRTPEQFIKFTTGSTTRDATTAVKVGVILREAATAGEVDPATGEVLATSRPWLAPVTAALVAREILAQSAEAICVGLGSPNTAVSAEQLRDAASQLCEVAQMIDPDAVARQARAFGDELDIDGVALRESERRQKRSLRLFVQPDGMTKLIWIMDPETAASVRELYDRATSPKVGGVRFAESDRKALSEAVPLDQRTPEQLASDDFEQLLRLGSDSDPRFLLGSGAPAIRVTATKASVAGRLGIARIEGQSAPVSIAALERMACGGAVKSVTFDESGVVRDLGREQRFFNRAQKEALALMWGGCAAPGCERPPSWTEAHHIAFWHRDHGRTDLLDGILLCRHHHLLFHNGGWEIRRDELNVYWLITPAEHDPHQTPVQLTQRGSAVRDLRRERQPGRPGAPAIRPDGSSERTKNSPRSRRSDRSRLSV
jgi:hypothetical protein